VRIHRNEDGTLNLNCDKTAFDDLTSFTGLPISSLIISQTSIQNLSPLQGMRLHKLMMVHIKNQKPIDLTPLHGMPLDVFAAGSSQVIDFSPLAGMKLQTFGGDGSDFRPLRGMPLTSVNVHSPVLTNLNDFIDCPIVDLGVNAPLLTDISAVRTMHLKSAHFAQCRALRDFTPLLDCPLLERVKVPPNVAEIKVLRQRPKIFALDYDVTNPERPAAEFWKEFDAIWKAKEDAAAAMAKISAAFAAVGIDEITADLVQRQDDGTYFIKLYSVGNRLKKLPDLHGLPISHISLERVNNVALGPLAGMPLREFDWPGGGVKDYSPLADCRELVELKLSGHSSLRDLSFMSGLRLQTLFLDQTSVVELSMLRGMPLKSLDIHNSGRIRDLGPLAGLPLQSLRCEGTKVTDLRPLLSCSDLEMLTIPTEATNVGELRALKKLKRMSYKWDRDFRGPTQSAEEFWKEYDEKHPANK
jgi:hypothetical protein